MNGPTLRIKQKKEPTIIHFSSFTLDQGCWSNTMHRDGESLLPIDYW